MLKKISAFILLLANSIVYANSTIDANTQILSAFHNWTYAFNHKDLQSSCDFFAKDLKASYQSFPEKNYHTVCDGFAKIFSDPNKQYHYDYKINDIFINNNLAAVRITWFLTVYEKNNIIEKTTDQGLDVLIKNKSNHWQIVNYLGYKEK